jgi:hypothetical protein
MLHRRTIIAGILALLLSGCSSGSQHTLSSPFTIERLYFGRNIDTVSTVSDSAWTAFVATSVTPRFPNGFTFWRAEGQWRRADGVIVHEQSFVLEVIHPAEAKEAEHAINLIINEYKRQFRQEAVLHVVTPARARF